MTSQGVYSLVGGPTRATVVCKTDAAFLKRRAFVIELNVIELLVSTMIDINATHPAHADKGAEILLLLSSAGLPYACQQYGCTRACCTSVHVDCVLAGSPLLHSHLPLQTRPSKLEWLLGVCCQVSCSCWHRLMSSPLN